MLLFSVKLGHVYPLFDPKIQKMGLYYFVMTPNPWNFFGHVKILTKSAHEIKKKVSKKSKTARETKMMPMICPWNRKSVRQFSR